MFLGNQLHFISSDIKKSFKTVRRNRGICKSKIQSKVLLIGFFFRWSYKI